MSPRGPCRRRRPLAAPQSTAARKREHSFFAAASRVSPAGATSTRTLRRGSERASARSILWMVVKAWIRRMSEGASGGAGEAAGGEEESPSRRWPVGILRRSGARAARRVLHVKYRSVPTAPAPLPLPLDIDDTVSCFCRKARRKEREGEPTGDPKLYLQEALLERKLPELDMRQLVDLPHGLDYNEWLASHTLALFEHVNLLYGTVSEFCTAATCPDMTGPGGRTYAWYDERGKKSRVAAPQYVDYVMTYTQKTINDETIFPTKYANEFPAQFESVVRRVVRLLFHVVAHMYAAHFRHAVLLGLHAHLHLTFAHLTTLHRRYALLDHKETDVLRDLEAALQLTPAAAGAGGAAGPGGPAGPGAAGPTGADEREESPRRRSPVVTQPLATA